MLATEFTHPDDAAALKALESTPLLPQIMKKVMELATEKLYYGLNLATKVKLSPTQLPEIYHLLPPICQKLGIKEPELYLEMNPSPNAFAQGETYTSISLTSGLVEMMTQEELTAILAHECGHILCHHMLYHSLVNTLLFDVVGQESLQSIITPVYYSLMYWYRKSELSADRVSAFIAGPKTAISALARLSSGPRSITSNLNLIELAEQADLYDKVANDGFWNKTLQMSAVMTLTHPFSSVRIREILRWVTNDSYKELMRKYSPNQITH